MTTTINNQEVYDMLLRIKHDIEVEEGNCASAKLCILLDIFNDDYEGEPICLKDYLG